MSNARRAFVLALLLGLVWLSVMSPLAVPDEEYHYRVSWCVSNYLLGQWRDPLRGTQRYFDFTGLRGHYNVPAGYARLFGEILADGPEGESVQVLDALPSAYLPMYLPQTLGLALARILRLGFGGAFLLGRGANALFYALCLGAAAALAPQYKTALAAGGLLPMALHQAASFSYDGFELGMALVYSGALLGALSGEGPLGRREWTALFAGAVLLAPAKGGCLPLLGLVWLIPAERFGNARSRRRRLWGLTFAAALAMAVFFLPTVSRQIGGTLNWEGEHNYTLAFLLRRPAAALGLYGRTLRSELGNWLLCMAGSSLAGLTLPLPVWIPAALLLLLPPAGMTEGPGLSGRARLAVLAAAAGMVLLSMTVMLLTWTSDTRLMIQGVQGRYFLPAAPLLSAALAPTGKLPRRGAVVTAAVISLNLAAAACVLQYTAA